MSAKHYIIVYDTTKGFSSFVKKNFGKTYPIAACTSKKKFSATQFKSYTICFFIVNDINDLLNLVRLNTLEIPVIVGTASHILDSKIDFVKNERIFALDFSQSKEALFLQLQYYLQVLP
jgi:hypothetical protein